MGSVVRHYRRRVRTKEAQIDYRRRLDRKNSAQIDVVEGLFLIGLTGVDRSLCRGDALRDIGASAQQLGRMGRRKRYNGFEILAPRAKPERCITTSAHAQNNDSGCPVAFQPRCSRVDVGKTFEIALVVNPRSRPAHFRSLD